MFAAFCESDLNSTQFTIVMIEEKTSTSKVKKLLGGYKFRVEGYSALSTRFVIVLVDTI